MIESISRRPAPSLRSATVVIERCKLKVEKNARKASSSLFCDSAMSQTRFECDCCCTSFGPLCNHPVGCKNVMNVFIMTSNMIALH